MISISKKANVNYLAKIVKVPALRKHPNADRLSVMTIDGNDIITANTTVEGTLSIYFPLECQIAHEYLSANNDYRQAKKEGDKTWGLNADSENKGGFFEATRRVKAVKLRDQKSEGYVVPVTTLEFLLGDKVSQLEKYIGQEFDTVGDLLLVKKYIVQQTEGSSEKKNRNVATKHVSKLIDNQFRLHYDTSKLGSNLHKINPDTVISLSWKMHGISFVSSNVLCKKPLKWYEKLLQKLGVNIVDTEYSNIYSSRKVVKGDELNPNANHYYKEDIWAEANKLLKDNLLEGESVYGEIVGYTKSGQAIQKGYDYGCKPGEFKIYVYRITQTSSSGKVLDLPFNMVQERCEQLGVSAVPEIFFGKAEDLVQYRGHDIQKLDGISSADTLEDWRLLLFDDLKTNYVYNQDCQFCLNTVPAEGVVLRVEGLKAAAYKLKSFAFLNHETAELDAGITNLEDSQIIEEENA